MACFAAAYARCQAATLTRNALGLDTEEADIFVIEPNDKRPGCVVGMSYTFSFVGNNRSGTQEVRCATVTSASGTLTFRGCGSFGAFTVP